MSLGGKILMLGATGQVALPLTLALAGDSANEVWGVARFSDKAASNSLTRQRCLPEWRRPAGGD